MVESYLFTLDGVETQLQPGDRVVRALSGGVVVFMRGDVQLETHRCKGSNREIVRLTVDAPFLKAYAIGIAIASRLGLEIDDKVQDREFTFAARE